MSESAPVPESWDATKMVPIRGYRAIVTGATSGTGTVAARELARQGAHVVLACRNEEKARAIEKSILADIATSLKGGSVEFMQVDLSELSSVRAFVKQFRSKYDRLDLLVNNAGILAPPYTLTSDGFELQFATNHLGHFVLTALLFPLLRASSHDARIVSMSSILHRAGWIDMDHISTPKEKYSPMGIYAQTKLYNMLFIMELNRRLHEQNITNVKAVVAHPGYCNTSITRAAGSEGASWIMKIFSKCGDWFPLGQSPEMGALPMLYAANAENVQSGDFYGPNGLFTRWGYPQYDLFTGFGYPALEQPSESGRSVKYGKWLWEESERVSQLKFKVE